MGFTSLAEFGSYVFAAADSAGVSAATVSAAGTAAETAAGAVATGVATNAIMGGKRPIMPPSPVQGAQQQDLSVQNAEADAQRRQSIAGGINSTVGTQGGQEGAMLNPGNMAGHSLLGQ